MRDVNRVFLMGRLGTTPVLRETKNGLPVTQFSLATQQGTEETRQTEWHRIVVWGKHGQTCAEHLSKGQRVYVEGNIRSHSYSGKDGLKKISYEIHADQVNFLDRPLKRNVTEEQRASSVVHEAMEEVASEMTH